MTLLIILVDAAFCDLGPEKSHFPQMKNICFKGSGVYQYGNQK